MESLLVAWKHKTTYALSHAILGLSPANYESWFNTEEKKTVLLGVMRELLTRFLEATSKRYKNMALLSDAKLSQPFIEFFYPTNQLSQTHGQRQEYCAMMYFYRSFIAIMQAYISDSHFIFGNKEFSPKFLAMTYLNELESSLFHYITWIEVNQRDNNGYMAVRVIEYYHAEKRRTKFDVLGLLRLYHHVLEFLWNRPLTGDDCLLLNTLAPAQD